MSLAEQKIINEAVAKLELLNGEDFHGYRSEVWDVISNVVKLASEQAESTEKADNIQSEAKAQIELLIKGAIARINESSFLKAKECLQEAVARLLTL